MRRNEGSSLVGICLVGLMIIIGCFGCASGGKQKDESTEASQVETTPRVSAPAVQFTPGASIPFYPPPGKMDLCGEPVPLQSQEVQERFDKEFTLIVYNPAQVYLWLKRMERYFPWIEQRLRSYALPEDLKYVAIAESDLLPNACSPKGAAGPWQFMKATGSSYGLNQRGPCDERYDFERSTESAFRFLRDLNRRFNSWSLAIAAYNCGAGRVQEEMRSQGITSYYHLRLPQETERYVMRILAIKAVMSNPAQYGYNLPKGQGYPELKMDRISWSTSRPVSLQTVASAAGVTYREIKRLNPAIRSDMLQPGTYELKLPQGTEQGFRRNIDGSSSPTQLAYNIPSLQEAKVESSYQTKDYAGTEAFQSGYDENQSQYASYDSEEMESDPTPSPRSASSVKQSSAAKKPEPIQSASARERGRSSGPTYHTVAKGETLFSIARRYRVSVDDLRTANKIKTGNITPGQKLKIPQD